MRQSLKIGLLLAAGVVAAARGLLSHERSSADPPAPEGSGRSGEAGLKRQLQRTAKYFAAFILVMTVGGFLLAASGIIPIKASSGHWGITRWFLNFSSQRSVSTHTLGLSAPPLDEPGLVLRGAGAYETNCRACHGSPSLPAPRVAQGMTPRPPYLPSVLSEWENEELFYIVKHGIKFTGMPAWPAQQRDDEVWAVVAFLRALANMSEEEYRRLVYGGSAAIAADAPMRNLLGPETAPLAIIQSCGRCHGAEGLGRGVGAFPRLAGQRPEYLYGSLQAYARGERHSGIMEPVAAGLSDEEMREIALYYGRLEGPSPSPARQEDATAIERGRVIASQGVPTQRVPSCVSCHGPSAIPRNPNYPVLAGQYADYLVLQLDLFKREQRGGSAYSPLMRTVAARLTPEQMRDVALFFQSLASADDRPSR